MLEEAYINNLIDRSYEIWYTLGECYSKTADFKNVMSCFSMALALEKSITRKYLTIKTYTQLGILHLELGQVEKARSLLDKEMQKGELYNDEYRLVESMKSLAECQIVQKDDLLAYNNLVRALSISRDYYLNLEFDILLILIDICERYGLKKYGKYASQFIELTVKEHRTRRTDIMYRFETDPPEIQF
ncbi:hypothetical protein IC619_014060 [Hazenella sp. IB182353]|uniref:hypothetical protein n=1 Tax=Polycladospora coralii TaxID=2771432 RepID=UPI0017467872|nr:hypothetical protein [Polycladospora coralii]MBS7531605.1 hypothetical protein [Polycladospora coralii]